MGHCPRILLTLGEPAGIGPDITSKIAQTAWNAELIVVGDPTLLLARAELLDQTLKIVPVDLKTPAQPHQTGTLKFIPVPLNAPCQPGQLNILNAPYVVECLEKAVSACLSGHADALVTGPIQKSLLNEAGIPFSGHTEFLASACHIPEALMLFVVDTLKVALMTTHIPISQVAQEITKPHLQNTLRLLASELNKKFGLAKPNILVCGLNPHAGEQGHIGREEIDIMQPALNELREENFNIMGPLSADTIFTPKYLKLADCILAMYHDQALPVIKHLGFGHAVNVTLGLPIIRTSVDHGTALDIAGTKKADASSLEAAIRLAIDLAVQAPRSRQS